MENRRDIVRSFFPGTARSYDFVVRCFTLGLDVWWKRGLCRRVVRAERILDLACGTGIVTQGLARRFPQAEFVGVDVTADYLEIYRERIAARGVRASAILGDAEEAPLDGVFDAVVSSYLPKYVDPDRLLAHVAPHVNPGGVLVVHDFTLPPCRLVRTMWNAYTRAMNLIGRRFFPEWKAVFDGGLTRLIRQTDWFETWPAALDRHGFHDVQRTYLTLGCSGLVWATRRAEAGSKE